MRESKIVPDLLTTRLLRLSNTLGLYSSRRYREQFDVTLPEWRVLSIIGALETTSARDVSRALATDKAWVGLTVQKLERRDFVRRVPDCQDGRRTLVSLTRQGKEVYDAIMANARRRQKRLLGTLTEKDAETLIASIERLQVEADRMLEELDES
ncbi:MAG: MarR family transcriptional regulator [Reyranella sp.]|uniref:MarR family winged helix-turn-helix transcriptional regulator n=1 Tax=Reyranella sp. TaxID=1929291 RepID=UPI00121A26D7|nr:MarR family transcriptional regulator [Reyranella sp.]TAJ97457.1 MAG: MarR family transcriptional regulator [Reyranella sp.]TBR28145.1 MAG: MarR family transcriptional regulator [Reyranella sp.]